MTKFNEVREKYAKTLEQYVPIVERVHGKQHPEFYEVRKIFDTINEKIQSAGENKPELEEEFKQLRQVTNDYNAPEDTCESYEAVYNMLGELDRAYHS